MTKREMLEKLRDKDLVDELEAREVGVAINLKIEDGELCPIGNKGFIQGDLCALQPRGILFDFGKALDGDDDPS